jgi:hypothetical protein
MEVTGGTNSGNLPLHLAMYSLRTVPFMSSLEMMLAHSAESGIIISPDVSLSRRLIAVIEFSREIR